MADTRIVWNGVDGKELAGIDVPEAIFNILGPTFQAEGNNALAAEMYLVLVENALHAMLSSRLQEVKAKEADTELKQIWDRPDPTKETAVGVKLAAEKD